MCALPYHWRPIVMVFKYSKAEIFIKILKKKIVELAFQVISAIISRSEISFFFFFGGGRRGDCISKMFYYSILFLL